MKLFSYEIIMLAAIDYISIVVKNKKKNIILLETTDIKLLITIYIDISLQLLLKQNIFLLIKMKLVFIY